MVGLLCVSEQRYTTTQQRHIYQIFNSTVNFMEHVTNEKLTGGFTK